MVREKTIGHLVAILFISMLGGNIIGEALRVVLHFAVGQGTLVERALLNYFIYPVGPLMLNLVILSFSFQLSLNFNVITLLGIFVGYYYFKYSY
jgi:hypothetical protein